MRAPREIAYLLGRDVLQDLVSETRRWNLSLIFVLTCLEHAKKQYRSQDCVRFRSLRVLQSSVGGTEGPSVLDVRAITEIDAIGTNSVSKRGESASVEGKLQVAVWWLDFHKRDEIVHEASSAPLARDEHKVGHEMARCLGVGRDLDGRNDGIFQRRSGYFLKIK